jgi:magnesium transporter
MRVFTLLGNGPGAPLIESSALPKSEPDGLGGLDLVPSGAYTWIACTRAEFDERLPEIQSTLQRLGGAQLVDLHVSDLQNATIPSHYDYTSQYDILVFRRLATLNATAKPPTKHPGPAALQRIDTSPVGFAVFDRVLLTVHPADCAVREAFAAKLLLATSAESRAAGVRLPSGPPDLMLRLVNQIVDGYLELRRELTRQLDHWQTELINPSGRFANWKLVLDTRLALHALDEICEDQRAAVQDWIDALETWPDPANPTAARERELLKVRSRDVLEHIERVVHHVRRLEQSAETAVQMHFSVQSHRTNDIMRTLTVLTAVFLPLNLITGFFGMNFDALPLIHSAFGIWLAMGAMLLIAMGLVLFFWRKRYLARSGR